MSTLIIGAHGLGDCLMSLQAAKWLSYWGSVNVALATRDEIFKPIEHLFGKMFDLRQLDASLAEENALLKDSILPRWIHEAYDEVYYVIPDLLFNNKKYAFPYRRFNTDPQAIKRIRLLDSPRPTQPLIYLALNTTTFGYAHPEATDVARLIAERVKPLGYMVHMPIVTKWNSTDIPVPKWASTVCPNNLEWVLNPSFTDEIDLMRTAQYMVCLDNGPSHLGYHMGIPRLLLDPQYNKLPWMARWREDYMESIPISADASTIADIVFTNLDKPQTMMVPRMHVMNYNGTDWNRALYLKEA